MARAGSAKSACHYNEWTREYCARTVPADPAGASARDEAQAPAGAIHAVGLSRCGRTTPLMVTRASSTISGRRSTCSSKLAAAKIGGS